jgi:phosphonate transport system permease protein
VSGASIQDKLAGMERTRRVKQALFVVLLLAVIAVTYWGLGFVQFDIGEILDGLPKFQEFIGGFFPPNFEAFTVYTKENGIPGSR